MRFTTNQLISRHQIREDCVFSNHPRTVTGDRDRPPKTGLAEADAAGGDASPMPGGQRNSTLPHLNLPRLQRPYRTRVHALRNRGPPAIRKS